jgi:dTDP-4-amino-4,6-dideoxygalactose transaminase
MDPIMAIAKKHKLFVIEDACQAIGAEYKGKKAGSFGDVGCFSFYPTKNLGGVGDGGMIVTNNEELAEHMKIMRNHGMKPVYHYRHIGANFRLDALQAAALLVKVPHLAGWSKKRAQNAAHYDAKFESSPVQTPYISDDCVSIYHQYVIRAPKRDELFEHLKSKSIGSAIFYPIPLHLNECFEYLGCGKGSLEVSEKAAQEVLALPIYPEMTDAMLDEVAEAILEFYA